MTRFAEKVYDLVQRIPAGKVSTYGIIAEQLGTRAYRAVGQALRRNPRAPDVPCHRVVRSDLSIGGFNGATEGAEVSRKKRLLLSEGVRFEDGHVSDDCVFRFN